MIETLAWINAPCSLPNAAAAEAARQRQNQLTKPYGSLGRLEEMAIALAGMQNTATPSPDPIQVLQFLSDHGAVAEDISAFPQIVTLQMLRNMSNGGAPVTVMARALNVRIEITNVGTVSDAGELPNVRNERLGDGTGNIAREPAMNERQLIDGLNLGRAAVERALATGAKLLICGEMGIGSTTSATALACALLGESAESLVGPGTGLNATGVARKTRVIDAALALHAAPNTPPLELLRRLAGFDIVATVGAFLTAAQHGLPIIVDGFIMSSAALAAVQLQPQVREWMLFATASAEPGHQRMMTALNAKPYLNFGLRLGEATGALAVVPLLRLACELHQHTATFAEAGVSQE
ncbi:nicotinate-nucleotide--dimethylbenzimidazole phosphoribosyltransferase [Chromatium weissei]|nr:nicotinate-nucleotide--dimethylbenzimidazole phosphoribosyltransferase [Chromatium weissei]